MITKTVQDFAAAALTVLPLLAATPAHARADVLTLADGIQQLPLAAESRDGYQRTSFKHCLPAPGLGSCLGGGRLAAVPA
ncbi:hypothetical protein [Streptomyces sp. NPDC057580]|uniref:hypothetical protein n=1 Tax=Streptomyces sp. NPDC057580 TaxID=3346173 RepID=UPI00368D5007